MFNWVLNMPLFCYLLADDDLFTMVNQQYTNQLMCPMTSTASNAPEIDDVKPSLNTFEMEVRNKIYPKELYKRQVCEGW